MSLPTQRRPKPFAQPSRRPMVDALEQRTLFAAVAGSIDATKAFQTIDSLGAASIHWKHPVEQQSAGFYDQLVNDLGASGVRSAVMPNFEFTNDNADPNVFDWSKFKSSELAHVMQFNQRMKERGTKSFFMSVWSPPYWMKTNKSTDGGGALRADMRAEFAEYLAAVAIASKRDFGIELAAISIQNEPFFAEPYESAMYDAAMMRETVIAVQQKFARENISTKVMINEDVFDTERWLWLNGATLADDQVDRSKLIVGSHWMYPDKMNQQASQLAGTGIPLWYTEVSGKTGTWADGVNTARELSDTFTKANASAYYYWVFNDNTTSDPVKQTPSLMGNGTPNAKYHALKHFYKYVRPGMQRVQTSIDETAGMRLSAFRDPTSRTSTFVLLNDSLVENTVTLSLSGLGAGTAAFRGFRSSDTETWQSMGTIDGSGSTITLTIPANGMITLHNGVDPTPIAGVGSPPLPISTFVDPVSSSGLRKAAMRGDITEVTRLLNAGANPNATDPLTGWTALHAAAAGVFQACEEIVTKLIAAGANVNAVDVDGFTPLHAAAMNQWVEWVTPATAKANIVGKLVAAGAAVDALDSKGRTPLIWAAIAPASTDYANYNTRVHTALTSRGANQLLRDAAGLTAYDYAVREYKGIVASHLSGTGRDTQSPFARYAKFSPERNAVSLTITENVTATFDLADVRVINRATGATVALASLTDTFHSGMTNARVKFATRLADGHYRLTVAAGAFTDPNGLPSKVISHDFSVMSGDLNGDNAVNFADLVILSRNYNMTGRTYGQGDLNEDGTVDFADLTILAQRYNRSLAPAPALVTSDIAMRSASIKRLG